MGWPGPIDYNEALQHPERSFTDADLQQGRVETNRRGMPSVRAGGFALVYKLQRGPRSTAVRVFLYPSVEREQRYRVVHDHLARQRPRCLVDFGYQPRGIRVGRDCYPLLTMPWVAGVTLGAWMHEVATRGEVARLRAMAGRWVALIEELRRARIAHGDLQHGNILIVGEETPVLVDYDGLCVPALVGLPAPEVGLPAYQHPGRRQQSLALNLDDFSAWIIFVALRAVAADPALWRRFVVEPDNENLLFRDSDITAPGRSPLWEALAASPDRRVRDWSKALRASIDGPFEHIPPFQPDAPTAQAQAAAPPRANPTRGSTDPPSRPVAILPAQIVPTQRDALDRLRQMPPAATRANDRAVLDPCATLRPELAALGPTAEPNRRRAEAAIRRAVAAADRISVLVEALRHGDHATFLGRVDLALVHGSADAFRPYRRVIEGWIRAHVLRDRPIRPTLDPPVVRGSTATIRSGWAKPHLVTYCLVAVRDPREAATEPASAQRFAFERYRREGGIVVALPPGPHPLGARIWPVVDLGWTELRGVPIDVGPFRLPSNVKARDALTGR